MAYDRITRVNEVLKREISEWFEKNLASEIKALVTFTKVETSADLQHAKVFVSIFGGEAQETEAFELLEQHRPSIQKQVAKRVKLKFTPVLQFEPDHTPEEADHVLKIIEETEADNHES